tara:strand:+ start:1215 stop:1982 length:768 start_codon:yes stop_codon:yes gene_type:complete
MIEEKQQEEIVEEEEKESKPILSKSVGEASAQTILQALDNGVSEDEIFNDGETKRKIRGESFFSQEGLDELTDLSGQGSPIPGQSLVNSPDSKYPWENPPTFSNPREALDDVATTILQPDTAKNIVKALSKGAAAIDLTMGVLYSKFLQGDISVDNLLLLAEPTTYMIMALGEEANIKYNIEGNDLDELDNEDTKESFDKKVSEFRNVVQNIGSETAEKVNVEKIDSNIVPRNILDKIKEEGPNLRKSLLDKGEE